MKKFMIIWTVILIALGYFCYVIWPNDEKEDMVTNHKLKVVATIFPEYDWVREIVGVDNKNVELKLLLKNGVDLHSYQPSSEDMLAIAEADVFIYVGGHSDKWVDSALKNSSNPDRVNIDLFDILRTSLKPLVVTEGMEHHHHDADEHHHHDADEHHHHDDEYDEHVWLSLPRTKSAVQAIAEKIVQADPDHGIIYRENAKKYLDKLEKLDEEYRLTISKGSTDTIVFGDRFPFFYLADDYGLHYYAAFTGCSADSEASFATVACLAQKIDQLGLNYIFTIENSKHRIAETVVENTHSKNQKILVMNSLQSVTEQEIASGLTYLSVMRNNLEALKTALK